MAASACDSGDGTTLRDPTTPTSFPPPDTTPLSSAPITTAVLTAPDTTLAPATLPDEEPTDGFRVFAPWVDGGEIDPRFGCDGSNVSPALSWTDVPDGAVELAIAFVDEDNLSNGRPFIHWVMGGISPDSPGSLAEGEVPVGAVQALNFFGDVAYAGPCPNPGETNTYRLTLYALGQQLELLNGSPATEFLDTVAILAMEATDLSGSRSR